MPDDRLTLALEAAAAGLVSGVLGEWPYLARAFEHHGVVGAHGMPAVEMRETARRLLADGVAA